MVLISHFARRLACFVGLAVLTLSSAAGQDVKAEPTPELSRQEKTLDSLRKLLERRDDLSASSAASAASDEGASADGPIESAEDAQDAVDVAQELEEIDRQIELLAAGVSDSDLRGDDGQTFDLNTEVQSLLEPFVSLLKDATENAREIERLRRGIVEVRRRESTAQGALRSLGPLVAAARDDPALSARLIELEEQWRRRRDSARDLKESLERQLESRLENRGASEAAANEAASTFFRDRGLSLLFGVSAFLAVMVLLRMGHRTLVRLRGGDRQGRSFRRRLFDLVYTVLTAVIAVVAMLAVFNARHDWLLLAIAGLLLITVAWVGLKLVPGVLEQVTLLLNLGAVQEGERLLFEGVPYRVRKLDFYSDLENPLLDGADITIPVRTLTGLHSRASGSNEPWFPTRKGDWVRLADETRGRVVGQSPETVELEIPGGSHVTYTTPDFLAEKPVNLSLGYRAEIQFGIGYAHQADATGKIIDLLREHVRAGLLRLVAQEQLKAVSVELMEAADSALLFEVEADLTGDAAFRMEEIERELARLCVDACNVHGWEIPFPQMVVHRVKSAT